MHFGEVWIFFLFRENKDNAKICNTYSFAVELDFFSVILIMIARAKVSNKPLLTFFLVLQDDGGLWAEHGIISNETWLKIPIPDFCYIYSYMSRFRIICFGIMCSVDFLIDSKLPHPYTGQTQRWNFSGNFNLKYIITTAQDTFYTFSPDMLNSA